MRALPALVALGLGASLSCAARQERAAAPPAAAAEPGAPSAQAVTNPPLAAALEELCRVATEEAADRSRPVEERLERTEERLEGSPHEEVLEAFFDRIEHRGGDRLLMEAVTAQAAQDGVPGYRCEPFARMLVLYAAGDRDLDPELVATPDQDLVRLCAVATEVAAEAATAQADPAMVALTLAERLDEELTCPEVRQIVEALAHVPPETRVQLLESAAAEVGLQGWTCPALAAFWP